MSCRGNRLACRLGLRHSAMMVGLIVLTCSCSSVVCGELTADSARESIRRAIEALKSRQLPDGNWPAYEAYNGGSAALCTLALLNAGVPVDDPHVASGLAYLRGIESPSRVYSTALRTMVFCAADPDRDRFLIRQNVKWLQACQVRSQHGKGGWSYSADQDLTPDNSNSQFALLALDAAQQVGVPVSQEVWRNAKTYWRERQLRDGSWGYGLLTGKGSMTCAGICSLIIAERNLSHGNSHVSNGEVVCCVPHAENEAITKGLDWLGRNFSVARNPSSDAEDLKTYHFYYLYGMERVGRLSGRRLIGQHDWYREGAEFLVSTQTLNGHWIENRFGGKRHISTAFGLLFLSKGQRPVVMSKLSHPPDDDWNRHRSDVANLTQYVEQRWRQKLTWQVIHHSQANVEDLLQSPILFISGRDGLEMSAKEKESLRKYIEMGGFVFAEACCGGKEFDRAFRELMAELFPDNPLRLLPPDHPVWYAEQRIDPDYLKPLFGIDTCCRTSVVYCPENLGCFWDLDRGDEVFLPTEVRAEVDAAMATGANVVAYATNRVLRDKLEMVPVPNDDSLAEAMARGSLQIAKLQHHGGSDDAPRAITNALRAFGSQLNVRVNTRRTVISPLDKSLSDFPIAFFQGRRNFSWTEEERSAIAEFVANGGFLFGDSICASQPFTVAIRRELAAIFPNAKLMRIPAEHPMFSDQFKGFDLSSVELRHPPQEGGAGPAIAKLERVTPVLEGVQIDGRFVAVFSPFDLSCALENPAAIDCEGYSHKDAARIITNIVLYAMQQ